MVDIEQKYKDLYNTYGGKSIRLIFFKDNFRALYPSETLYPSDQLYPAEMDKDSIAFEITDDMIHTDTLTITESLCSDENLNFGACESAQMEIVVSDSANELLMPKFHLDPESGHLFCIQSKSIPVSVENNHVYVTHEKNIEFSVNNGHVIAEFISIKDIAGLEFALVESFGDFELIRGLYTVESVPKEADKKTRRIIAYDRMRRFDNDVSGWYNSLKFPMTIKEFRNSLCDFVNVPQDERCSLINDDIEIVKGIETDSLNGHDVMRYICQINGVFGNVNSAGELRYITVPQKNDITDTITTYKSVESEEYTVPDIDTVKIQKEEGDIGGVSDNGDDMNVFVVEGNFLTYGKDTAQQIEIANNILSVISNLEYCPATIEGNSSPWYEMGDRIRIKTSDGDVDTIIMRRTSKGIQGAIDAMESTGTQELKRMFNIRSEFMQTKGFTAVLKRTVTEISSELRNFEEDTTSKFIQTAEQISAEVTRAKEAEASLSIKADQIETRVTQKITDEANRAIQAESRITQRADKIELSVTQEIKDRQEGEKKLSSTITQTAAQIRSEVKNVTDGLSSTITQTATQIRTEVKNVNDALSSKIDQTAESITLQVNGKVDKGKVTSNLNSELKITGNSIALTTGHFTVDSNNLKVTSGGDVTVTGTINANRGKIGGTNGFTIETNKMYSGSKSSLSSASNGVYIGTDGISLGNNKFKVTSAGNITAVSGTIAKYTLSDNDLISGNVGMSSITASGAVSFWAGNSNRNSAPFRVTNQGKMYASNAEISGKITATSGKIGNWTIDANGLVGDRGTARGATISGGHIEGATLDVADGILQVEDGYANSSAIVRLGDFRCSDEYGRSIFQSSDEMTGMSGDTGQSGGLYLWAGYRGSGDYAFVVNNDDETRIHGSLHVSGNIYLNGTALSASGGGGGSISGSVRSLKVGYEYTSDWGGGDWLEIYPRNLPDINEHPEYEGMQYLWVALERYYGD